MCSRFVSNFLARSWFLIWLFPFLGILCMLAKLLQSYPTRCDPMDSSPPGSSVHGILQARILEWVATSFSMVSSQPRDQNQVSCFSCIGRWVLYHWATWEVPLEFYQFSSVTQSCPTLCDPVDCSTPGIPVHHQLLELAQIHVHWVGDAIQPYLPLSSPSPPALNRSPHQGLFKWVGSSHQVAKVLELQLHH